MAAEMPTFVEGHGAEHLPNGAAPVQAARAYVTILARGQAGYGDFQELGAVVRLARALREARAAYPLVVAVPPDVPDDLRRRLSCEGCVVRELYPLNDSQPGHFADGYYEGDDINYHSKLCCIFQFAEYDRVVCLDAARIQVLENMDDLFELDKGCMYVWMEYYSAGDKAWSSAPRYKIAYGNEESPDMVVWPAAVGELAAILCNGAVLVHEPGMSFGEALLGKNRAAELRALYSNAGGFAPLEHGMPFGEALLGKNRIAGLAAPYSNADASAREHGVGVTLGEPLLGKNRAAGLDAAPGSNAAIFAHPRGMAAGEALHATPAAPYAVQVSIDKALGANAGGSIVVEANAAGADARDVRGRGGNLSAFVGIVAASSAVTAVAGAVSPAVAFGFFVVLLGGLCLAVSTVRRA